VFRPVILEPGGDGDNDDDNESSGNNHQKRQALIIMDGFCPYHGGYMMQQAKDLPEVVVVPVLSEYLRHFLLMTEPEQAEQWQSMRIPTTVEQGKEWTRHLSDVMSSDFEIAGIYCESDSGLEDAEKLRRLLNLTCVDDPIYSPARRDKYLMNEMVGKAGLHVASQKMCKSLDEACEFAQALLSAKQQHAVPRVVVKPFRGVASESVYLCESQEQVKEAWEAITDTTVFGQMSSDKHDSVLVQEYLEGTEYALDVVSRNGEHKIAVIWKYDKRPANGAPFCYFQTKLVDEVMEPLDVPSVQEYVRNALTALGIRYGFTHNEVIMTSDRGPVLVEVNCRQHNMDFAPITMACIGYNALDMTLDALLSSRGDSDEESDWHLYPSEPRLRAFGCMVHLVNSESGTLSHVNHLEEMGSLPSFFRGHVYEKFQKGGEEIQPTIDIRSDAGWVQLIHEDLEQMQTDYRQIVEYMPTMFKVE